MRDDAVLAVTAAHGLGALRSDRRSLVAAHLFAAHLLAEGADGQHLVALASSSAGASGRQVDQLVPAVFEEVDAPVVGVEPAGLVFTGVLALTTRTDVDLPLVRRLVELAPRLDISTALAAAVSTWRPQGIPCRDDPEDADEGGIRRDGRPAIGAPRVLRPLRTVIPPRRGRG